MHSWIKNLWRGTQAPDPSASDESSGLSASQWHARGSEALSDGRIGDAQVAYRHARALAPANASHALSLGFALFEAGDFAAAKSEFECALALDEKSADALYFLGRISAAQNDASKAARQFHDALSLRPRFQSALEAVTDSLMRAARIDDARALLFDVIKDDPSWPSPLILLGLVCQQQGEFKDAIDCFERARALAPDSIDVLLPLMRALERDGQRQRANEVSRQLQSIPASIAAIEEEIIRMHLARGETDDALRAAERAVAKHPQAAQLHHLYGTLLQRAARLEDAARAYAQAILVEPSNIESRLALAAVEAGLLRYDAATATIREAVRLKPQTPLALGHLALAEWSQMQWQDWQALRDEICTRIGNGERAADPFNFLLVSDSLLLQRQCASLSLQEHQVPALRCNFGHTRIRLAYLSPDFRNHAVSFLIAGVIEAHRRERFEVFGFRWGGHQEDAMQVRMAAAFEHFIDLNELSDDEAVARMRELGIDIAVDLTGYTHGARSGIFARRAAPVQVNYLGYPATMGVPYLDYIVADRYVIPDSARHGYAEEVAYLPTCFQANDDRRQVLADTQTRRDFGLPADAFVFCSFHSTPKVTPVMFDIWMRLVLQTPGSVLWILCNSPTAEKNLYQEARARGVGRERIVIARDIDYPAHLARHRLADLLLDTLPFNAGTSASDALWVGLPLVTCSGEAFASRMAGSLVTALGLGELACASLLEYEALALRLAHEPALLEDIRARLLRARDAGVFSSTRVAAELEAAYEVMFQRSARGMAATLIDFSQD